MVCSSKRVDRDKAQRRRAIDDDVVVIVTYRSDSSFESGLTVRLVDHFYFDTDQIDVRGNHVQAVHFRLDKGILHGNRPFHQLVQAAVTVVIRREIQAGRGIGLRISVYDKYLLL